MPEPKKAPAQSSIAAFFRPKKGSTILMDDLKDNAKTQSQDNNVVDLTVGGSSSLEPIYCVQEEQEHIVIIDQAPEPPAPSKMKKHSFFSHFEEKVQKQKEAEASNDTKLSFVRQSRQVMREMAPIFPSFLGNSSRSDRYKSHFSYAEKTPAGFDMAQWIRLPIPRFADDAQGSFEGPSDLYRTSGVDQVYQAILDRVRGKKNTKPGRRWVFHDEEDEDDWLPTGFRELSAFNKQKAEVDSHVHLVVGPTGTGKSYLATRLATELNSPLTALTVVGNGPKGERTGRSFEDLLTSAEHHDLLNDSSDMLVVLVDEIDLVFEGDRGFVSGLATYLANVPPKHVVIMTSNASVNVLARFYSFARDVCVHELEVKVSSVTCSERPADFASLERASLEDSMRIQSSLTFDGQSPLITCIDDWRGPAKEATQFHQSSHDLFTKYARYITAQKHRPPAPGLSIWNTDRLPTWYRLEVTHAAAEEERALLKRRRQTTMSFAAGSRLTSYLRFPQDITSRVLSLYSLEYD